MEIEMENGPKLDRGKEMAKNGFSREFSIIFPFFCHFFAPVQLGAVFHFEFHFFFISGFWPFSMPYQPGRIPELPKPLPRNFSDCRSKCNPEVPQNFLRRPPQKQLDLFT